MRRCGPGLSASNACPSSTSARCWRVSRRRATSSTAGAGTRNPARRRTASARSPRSGALRETWRRAPGADWPLRCSRAPRDEVAAVYLNYPSNPCAVVARDGTFEAAIEYGRETGAAVVHDFAYGDLVFDGREPRSFLATLGAKELGVEMFSMSKSYGMAGWRLGFVLGNAEIVERINLLNDHCRVGIFRPVQEAAIAALSGPQESVAERTATYQRRRDRVLEVVDAICEGTFYVWVELPDSLTVERLLTEHRLALAPGEGFGPSGAGWARISLAVTDETLELG